MKKITENYPEVKLGMVGVSRDCFPAELTKSRLAKVAECAKKDNLEITVLKTIVENENDAAMAAIELQAQGVNTLVIYLGNFGPEGPTTILAKNFNGPIMICAASEDGADRLMDDGRGDAYCGMLNCSYNLGLRNITAHIPEMPVGLPNEIINMINEFVPVARIYLGIKGLKVFSFGPRPHDFYACNAPIKPLYDLGIEVMENSELDMLQIYNEAEGASEIKDIVADMQHELGSGNTYPDLLPKLAQFEYALTKFKNENLGQSKFAVFANKCWPAFEWAFGFVPCYINSRLASRGIPVACEVDLYGAVSEYMCTLATKLPATILDINNTAPADLMTGADLKGVDLKDLFMGFHCGNTPKECLCSGCSMKYQLIMHRLMEGDKEPDITRGTLEGTLRPGLITLFRLQSTADAKLTSYLAEGNVIDVDPKSFGAIGVIGVKEFGRFYRHVLIEKRFPHHTAMAFDKAGKTLFAAAKLLGIPEISTPRSAGNKYPTENPFS